MSFFDNNPWVGYAQRDYLVMKQQIITKIQDPNTGIPEITDYSESNPFIKRLSIWCGINEQLGYYVDNKGREPFLFTARLLASAILIAIQFDYRARGRIASTGQVTFTLTGPAPADYIIPIGTTLETATGIEFSTLQPCTILQGTTSITVDVAQWVLVPSAIIGNSTHSPNQVFVLTNDVVDNSVALLINNITPYTPIDSFVLAAYTDTVFKAQINKDGNFEIDLGDGVNGFIPPLNQSIAAQYYTCLGAGGNVGSNAITVISPDLVPPVGVNISVTNTNPTVGGTDAEGITALKKNVPLSLRTLYRAVTDQDYIDVTELAPGVARAGLKYTCGKFVDVYIAPNGGGIASPTLLANTLTFLQARKMITTFPRVYSAGQVIIEFVVNVVMLPNFYNSDGEAAVIAAMTDYFSVENQQINGTLYQGNIYQLLENLTGVDHTEVLSMRPLPYARPLNGSTPVMTWTREQLPAATNSTYKVTFTSTTLFKLLRNNVFLGTFAVGTLVTTPDLTFTITGTQYVIGNSYEFLTYVIGDSVVLNEPSLPAFDPNYLTLNVTGGLV